MILIFSDLDGTLLDHYSYSFEKAREAWLELQRRRIPVILCSSKTRAEIEKIRNALDSHDPFICENGAAAFMPTACFAAQPAGSVRKGPYYIFENGRPYSEVTSFLRELKMKFVLPLRGFHEMSIQEISGKTGLSEEDACLARTREYSEPFYSEMDFDPAAFDGFMRYKGFRLTRGGRFFHLSGQIDKGAAVRSVIGAYRAEHDSVISAGIGDSLNDLPMLRAVDYPFAVRKPSGEIDPSLSEPPVSVTEGIGPEGWNEAVFCVLKKLN